MTHYEKGVMEVASDYKQKAQEDEDSEVSSETYFSNLSDIEDSEASNTSGGSDTVAPTQDYYDLILMINMVNDLIDNIDEPDVITCKKIMNLHLDAANTAGVSTGLKLYSPRELYHLAIAKYYESRLNGDNHQTAMGLATHHHSNLKQYNRVIITKE